MLRQQSNWKQAAYLEPAAETRGTLEAYRSDSRYTVTLTGRDIHDDNRVDFVAEDFIDAEDNITFSSKHIECGLVELESRYGPLLPTGEKYILNIVLSVTIQILLTKVMFTDRKTDLIFTVKDFLFSHEPSSWRFDAHYNSISRSSRTQPTVIDFTDDATGAPHEVAQSHVSMYVNEVGHEGTLVENIDVSFMRVPIHYYYNISPAYYSRFVFHRR